MQSPVPPCTWQQTKLHCVITDLMADKGEKKILEPPSENAMKKLPAGCLGHTYIYIIYTYIQPHEGDMSPPARMKAQWRTYIYYKEEDGNFLAKWGCKQQQWSLGTHLPWMQSQVKQACSMWLPPSKHPNQQHSSINEQLPHTFPWRLSRSSGYVGVRTLDTPLCCLQSNKCFGYGSTARWRDAKSCSCCSVKLIVPS